MLDKIIYTVLVPTHRRLRIKIRQTTRQNLCIWSKMLAYHIIFVFSTNGTILSYILMHISCASCQWHRQKKPLNSYVVVYSLYAVGKTSWVNIWILLLLWVNEFFYNQLKGKQNCFEDKVRDYLLFKKKILCFDVQIQPPSWPTKPPQVWC